MCPLAVVINPITSKYAGFEFNHFQILQELSHSNYLKLAEISGQIEQYLNSLKLDLHYARNGYAYDSNFLLPVKIKGLFSTSNGLLIIVNNGGRMDHVLLEQQQVKDLEDFMSNYLKSIKEHGIESDPSDFLLPRKLLKPDMGVILSYSNKLGNTIDLEYKNKKAGINIC
jgi:hypothetical protein